MDFLVHLESVTLRSLVLFAAATGTILVLRVKGAAARHAVWTVVLAGMLALAMFSPLLPPVRIPVLKASGGPPAVLPELPRATVSFAPAEPVAPAPTWRMTWPVAILGVYGIGVAISLTRLLFGYLFTRRLVRAAVPTPGSEDVFSSTWISVPVTVGRKVLLPADWIAWDNPKLEAVLAHERTHVRRRDWGIALLAGVNRSLFWFHPLTWWLERKLASLAEEACDDSALLLVDHQPYAQALLDMAAAARTTQGRLVWEAMAMAKTAEVRKRIELILDETRQIPRAVTRDRWAALLLGGIPLVWLVSVTQLVPASAQEPQTPAAMAEYLKGKRQFSAADVQTMEQYLVSNPHDVEVRSQLIYYYYGNGSRERRIGHILWLVENHPESTAAVLTSQGVLPRESTFNTYAEYQRVLAAWKQAVATRKGDIEVLRNGARFLQVAGEFEQSEKLLLDAGALGSGGQAGPGLDQLARLYAAAILGATGDPKFPNPSPSFASRVRADLETSENGVLTGMVGMLLKNTARRPQPGQPVPASTLNLDDHPLLVSAIDFGDRLLERARQRGAVTSTRVINGVPVPSGVTGGARGGVSGGVPGGVLGGIVGSVPAEGVMPPPPIVKKVDPVYPPIARQARISGVVHLQVVIATDGTMKNMSVMSGHPLLVPAALNAARQWTFAPPPRELTTYLDIPFMLPPGEAPAGQAFNATLPVTPARIKVGGNVQASKLVKRVFPFYPPQARAEGIEGNVTLQIVISKAGKVIDATAIEGSPVLAEAAIKAVWQYEYQPTLLNGEPVEVGTTVTVPFRM